MKVNGRLLSIDVYIPELNLGIEFDGSYWHKDKQELDKLKTIKLEAAGIKIIRIRELPLKKINEIDSGLC
jgi:very-short-patch-repair endonuclease